MRPPRGNQPKIGLRRPNTPNPDQQFRQTVSCISSSTWPASSQSPRQQNRPRIDMVGLSGRTEAKVEFQNLPHKWGTLEVWQALKGYGNIIRIMLPNRSSSSSKKGHVIFSPPPRNVDWIHNGLTSRPRGGNPDHINFQLNMQPPLLFENPVDSPRKFPMNLTLRLAKLDIGVMRGEEKMLVMYSVSTIDQIVPEINLNTQRKVLDIKFGIALPSQQTSLAVQYKMSVRFGEMTKMLQVRSRNGSLSLVMPLEFPPFLYRKTNNIAATHDARSTIWDEKQTYFRQTGIEAGSSHAKEATTLHNEHSVVDIGRWLVYRFVFEEEVEGSGVFKQACQALLDHNVKLLEQPEFEVESAQGQNFWLLLSKSGAVSGGSNALSSMADLQQMTDSSTSLDWQPQYQLEVCISQGILHESSITTEFLERLATMDPAHASRLLEKAADCKQRIYDPLNTFTLQSKLSVKDKKIPRHCAKVCAATITPTTMYLASPTSETSNRIVREFQHHEDRFLRVKFTDEKYYGKIMSAAGDTQDEIFDRVYRTMVNGIRIGDRHFEFLAYGNAQFKEHGAYFFASAPGLTAEDIRRRMGSFDHIRVVAKYASRLGQCFSTTRAMPIRVRIEKIPDIERNGFTFTDGVGKVSPFLAQMVAEEYGASHSITDYPSVIQFRLGGCKGVLAVDPSLKGNIVQIRPSQEKFPATFHGLEVCKVSQFSSATLNTQIILILQALGVPNRVLVWKMKDALAGLEQAMTDEQKAVVELSKNVDFNQTSLTLAHMIHEGFMTVQDPFTISCLHLWRAWMTKYLKEKARIFIEQGAFVLGCVDETCTLKGHFDRNDMEKYSEHDIDALPEIFLQISDPDKKGRFKLIEGICTLARNPSLHPGDIRVVKAVNIPALHHLKNCVVLPQTGERDLGNMCSGGDLDGDEYLVMWDPDLIPAEWNHEAQNYEAPEPVKSDGPVSVEDVTAFFVSHMKNENLGLIATAHKYWADFQEDSVKSAQCLKLAGLHSWAVDYAKTGVPAEFPKELKVFRPPHWTGKANTYHSKKILGQLYDIVNKVPFIPSWELAFDKRILEAFSFSDATLVAAREVKQHYDEDVLRIMAQHGINSEFEVWSTWVLDHSQEINDYKFAESLGETVDGLKQQYQSVCYERAGTTSTERDWAKVGPFIAAMYKVTADELDAANSECEQIKMVAGREVPVRVATVGTMPLMSFPWIFPVELGQIANKRNPSRSLFSQDRFMTKPTVTKPRAGIVPAGFTLEPLPEIILPDGVVHGGQDLNLFHQDEPQRSTAAEQHAGVPKRESPKRAASKGTAEVAVPRTTGPVKVCPVDDPMTAEFVRSPPKILTIPAQVFETPVFPASPVELQSITSIAQDKRDSNIELPVSVDDEQSDGDDDVEHVVLNLEKKASPFDKLAKILGV